MPPEKLKQTIWRSGLIVGLLSFFILLNGHNSPTPAAGIEPRIVPTSPATHFEVSDGTQRLQVTAVPTATSSPTPAVEQKSAVVTEKPFVQVKRHYFGSSTPANAVTQIAKLGGEIAEYATAAGIPGATVDDLLALSDRDFAALLSKGKDTINVMHCGKNNLLNNTAADLARKTNNLLVRTRKATGQEIVGYLMPLPDRMMTNANDGGKLRRGYVDRVTAFELEFRANIDGRTILIEAPEELFDPNEPKGLFLSNPKVYGDTLHAEAVGFQFIDQATLKALQPTSKP